MPIIRGGGINGFIQTTKEPTTFLANGPTPSIRNANVPSIGNNNNNSELILVLKILLIFLIIFLALVFTCLTYCCVKKIHQKIKDRRQSSTNSFFQEEMTTFDLSHIPNENSFVKINI